MADFKFVRALNGMTPQTELVIAGGAMEVGDIVIHSSDKVIKATGDDTVAEIAGLCLGKYQEDGVAIADEDLVQILPLGPDILLEGTVNAAGDAIGTAVGIDLTSTVLSFDSTETNKVGYVYKVVDADDYLVQVRMAAL